MRYIAYTDGYYDMNDRVGASACVILDENGRLLFERGAARQCEYDPSKKQRNNEQEIGAIIRCVMCTPEGSSVVIHSDSQYAVKVLSGEWSAKANLGLIDRYHEEVRKRRIKPELRWVRGHNGNTWNEYADGLCDKVANSLRAGGQKIIQNNYGL